MSKVILVMEKPESCDTCLIENNIDWICPITGGITGDENNLPRYIGRLPNCPLKSLPKKRDGRFTYDEYGDGWDAGFNACIDEILKEEKWV